MILRALKPQSSYWNEAIALAQYSRAQIQTTIASEHSGTEEKVELKSVFLRSKPFLFNLAMFGEYLGSVGKKI